MLGFYAYTIVTEKLGRFSKAEALDFADGDMAFKFVGDNGEVHVLWNEKGSEIILPIAGEEATVTVVFGTETTVAARNGAVKLTLSATPVFVEAL